jgi:hypothetical protein
MLPPRPSGKYGRTMARLYTLVGAAHLVARVPKRSPARRAR